jgi:hypothetical protein
MIPPQALYRDRTVSGPGHPGELSIWGELGRDAEGTPTTVDAELGALSSRLGKQGQALRLECRPAGGPLRGGSRAGPHPATPAASGAPLTLTRVIKRHPPRAAEQAAAGAADRAAAAPCSMQQRHGPLPGDDQRSGRLPPAADRCGTLASHALKPGRCAGPRSCRQATNERISAGQRTACSLLGLAMCLHRFAVSVGDPQPDILGWSGSSEAHTKDGDIGPSSPTVMSLWLTVS